MSREERARQFQPFDALKGLKEALILKEYEHDRISMGDITEDKANKISNLLIDLDPKRIYRVTYYKDGHYLNELGTIKLEIESGFLKLNGKRISINEIYDIEEESTR